MDLLTEVRSGLPEGASIDLVEVSGGVRIRATYCFRHRLDGAKEVQAVGADPYRVYKTEERDYLASALRDVRSKIDAKARLLSLG